MVVHKLVEACSILIAGHWFVRHPLPYLIGGGLAFLVLAL